MRIVQIEYARALAAFLVLLLHVEITFEKSKYMDRETFHFLYGGDSGVQVFFVISGFVMYLVHRRDAEGSLGTLSNFVFKRGIRILLPLWLVTTGLLLADLAGLAPLDSSPVGYLLNYLPVPSGDRSVLSVIWTLRHELLFYAFFAAFLWNRRIGGILLVAWCLSGLFFQSEVRQRDALDIIFNTNNALFLFGVGLCYVYLNRKEALAHPALALFGAVIFAVTWYFALDEAFPKYWSNLGFGVGATLILAYVLTVSTGENAALLELGNASYSLYLIHFPVVSFLAKIWTKIGGYEDFLVRTLYFALTVVICIAASVAFHRLVEKPALSVANRLVRGAGLLPQRQAQ